ncbi:hypothetical protein IL252_16775 [Halomicrobium sp. IBSBa]|mgnify:CR=1 FL=1|uniref:hypothetical protein n=1 Tax=Halomicrobium sp. IBSBa TaxID=2778916 RepID=UPI001ABF80D6|nr:hypothetical protein [Halomicrobium sp. IBSBa]MBO4249463.1 hypothetical protein [Halomicrobium sp. IBSBa]
MSEFVRASRLYDAESGEPLRFDWAKMQPLGESQAEVERAVGGLLDEDARAR